MEWKIGPDLGPLMKNVERIADALQRIAKVAEDLTADKQPGEEEDPSLLFQKKCGIHDCPCKD